MIRFARLSHRIVASALLLFATVFGCDTYTPIRYELTLAPSVRYPSYPIGQNDGTILTATEGALEISAVFLQDGMIDPYIASISRFTEIPTPEKEREHSQLPELFFLAIAIKNNGTSPLRYDPSRFRIQNRITGETLRPISHEEYRKIYYGKSNDGLPYEWLFLPVKAETFLAPVPDWAIREHARDDTPSPLERKRQIQQMIDVAKRRAVSRIEPGEELRHIVPFPELPGDCRCRLTYETASGDAAAIRDLSFPTIPFRISFRYGKPDRQRETSEKGVEFFRNERETLQKDRAAMFRRHFKKHREDPELYRDETPGSTE